MRFANLILGVMGLGVAAAAGCGGGSSGSTGGSAPSTSSSTSSGSSSGGTGACAPSAACKVADKTCLGLVDNTGKSSFGLRMSQLDISEPPALAVGVVPSLLPGAITLDNPACNLDGTGTFSWLLEFDTTAGTLKTGGATSDSSPTAGYKFQNGMITQGGQSFNVTPITYTGVKPDAQGNFSVTTGQSLLVPIFITATEGVILPLQQTRITMGKLSASQSCIGSYNVAGLQVSDGCQATNTPPIIEAFVDGASIDGFITLEQADTVIIAPDANTSLCALIAQGSGPDAGGLVTTSSTGTVCARDSSNNIVYTGNWCSTTNATAAGGCADAVKLSAQFAASSVNITN